LTRVGPESPVDVDVKPLGGSTLDICVVGIDRNWAYNPECKAAGP